jgi:nucleoside-diphosphate-sugar epimerase
VYISDCSRLFEITDWRPSRGPEQILADTYEWIIANDQALSDALI